MKNSTYQLKLDGEKKFGMDFRYFTFLLSALQIEYVIQTLLPYANVIMDRYIYSVVAHHSVYGAATKCVTINEFPITTPDYYFLMVADEKVRLDRIAQNLIITEGDKRLKLPGSDLEKIDNRKRREQLIQKQNSNRHNVITFDNERYLSVVQTDTILSKMNEVPKSGSIYIEFGGKTFDDQHAARVLPGYHPDLKMLILKKLSESVEIVVAVSVRDLLRPRIRGDSQ